MNGKEIVNLIDRLEDEGVDPVRIIDIIRYVVLTDPDERHRHETGK